eukprot:CAMPEP_0114671734 /NCGR_PEP_ID=MMETSP0191-20121206/41639_1 /TAXON_ID=126664 /ORGANISM="Sorites sp." /LENGTH=255 /DNA_ID=CAMNT_0001932243 /DNA_START=18 /DNA_END=785 /DNA_ORIENTATION=+
MTATGGSVKLRKLERDFNGGDPIVLTSYQSVLSQGANMGFKTEDVLEAALVSDTTNDMQLVMNYIFSTESDKKKQYNKRKQDSKKDEVISPEKERKIESLKKLLRDIEIEKEKIKQLKQELKERKNVSKLDKYCEFIKGIIADEIVTPVEDEAIKKYREDNKIDDDIHEEAFAKLEIGDDEWTDYHREINRGGNFCLICGENPKEMCVFPCMHVCLCQSCGNDYMKKKKSSGPGQGTGCPQCGKKIKKIERVFAE